MTAALLLLGVALFLVLAAEFINGWTDAPNAIATVVSTSTLPLTFAVPMAVILNIAGAMSGTAVAATIGKGIVTTDSVTVPAIAAAMVSIIAWGAFAAHRGLPISKSHALVAGLAGAAAGTTRSIVCSTIWLMVRVTEGGAWSMSATVTMPVAMEVTKLTKSVKRTI